VQQPQGSHQQQAPGAKAEQMLQQQQLEHQSLPAPTPQQQQQQPTRADAVAWQLHHAHLSPSLVSALPPRVPRAYGGRRATSPSAPAALPAALQQLQVLEAVWRRMLLLCVAPGHGDACCMGRACLLL
jgi:hypothetical protein